MGLDVYAGTLTRYYSHGWKTRMQRYAEEHGKEYSRISPDGKDYDLSERDPEIYRRDIMEWMDWILESLARDGGGTHGHWTEDDGCPYYTDKPDWDAFGAMLLVTACHIYGEPVPPKVEKDWKYYEDPLIDMLCGDYGENMSLLSGVTWWLPLPLRFIMEASKPYGEDVTIGTTEGLKGELREINRNVWDADRETIIGWSSSEGYPDDWEMGRITNRDGETVPEYDTESLAKFAFSILYQAVEFSERYGVPIILDY